tara:strand:- start:325 stop:1566 length:1242 start_codon:yes stop_codon:yes gene_type:complete
MELGLILYHSQLKKDASTINEHINSFQRYSRRRIVKWNILWGPLPFFDRFNYNFIIFHYSLPPDHYNLDYWLTDYLRIEKVKNQIFKIAFFQDEYYHCKQRFDFIDDSNTSIIFTLLNQEYHSDTYLKYTKATDIHTTLAGYVDSNLIKISKRLRKDYGKRKYDIGYRARELPFYMGKGAQEKTDIAKFVIKNPKDLNVNIKIKEEDRLYGEDWYVFLSECKATIGVEAGVSIFDINGKIRKEVEKRLIENPKIEFKELHDNFLFKYENNIPYRMISPRIFEAAAFKCLMILFEGDYNGLIKPNIHYLELKKDFSNYDEIIDILKNNQDYVNEIIENAYTDLIKSEKFSYKNFIFHFDSILDTNQNENPMKSRFAIFLQMKIFSLFKVYRIIKMLFNKKLKPLIKRIIRREKY